jgi:uncharacterized protein (TIGR03437 family)
MVLVIAACAAGLIFAQPPAISQTGVVNAASRIPPSLAGGAIARGARFSIFGVRFGSSGRTTSVTLNPGGPVQLVTVTAEQMDALMPESAPLGTSSLVVNVNGQASAPFPVHIVESKPGIFSRNGLGWGPGRIANVGAAGHVDNTPENPARPQSRIALLVTGLGAKKTVEVMIGHRLIVGSVRTTGEAGEQEILAQIPSDAPPGCSVPVYLPQGPNRASNVVTIAIGTAPCLSQPVPRLPFGRLALGVISRTLFRGGPENQDALFDEAIVSFVSADRNTAMPPLLLLPPAGTCTGYTGSFQQATVLPNSISASLVAEFGGRGLDAGRELTMHRDAETRQIPQARGALGFYRMRLGGRDAPFGPRKLAPFLERGGFILTAPGGRDVPAMSIEFQAPAAFDWVNRPEINVIDRVHPPKIRWKNAGAGGFVVIFASNVDPVSTAIGTCICLARAETGEFTLPADLLANVPATGEMRGIPDNQLFVAWMPARATAIRASGLDDGALLTMYAVGRLVEYR